MTQRCKHRRPLQLTAAVNLLSDLVGQRWRIRVSANGVVEVCRPDAEHFDPKTEKGPHPRSRVGQAKRAVEAARNAEIHQDRWSGAGCTGDNLYPSSPLCEMGGNWPHRCV